VKTRIVIISHWFPITAAAGYLEDAARSNGDLEVVTVGPAHGDTMPWLEVKKVSEKYIRTPDIQFPPMNIGDSFVPIDVVENTLEDFHPDLWLTIDSGFRLKGKPRNGTNVVFYTDPHGSLRDIYDKYKSQYDFAFNPQPLYAHHDEYYLPYAADSRYHRPIDDVERIYDVCIIGSYYSKRVRLINELQSRGVKCFFKLGLAQEDARLVMNQSKICINWSSRDDLTARVFETMASRVTLLADRVPDLPYFFQEDVEFVGFDDIGEAIFKTEMLLKDEKTRSRIADNGLKAIERENHFWESRLSTILEVSGTRFGRSAA
jgi:spore maturation protein CgeB